MVIPWATLSGIQDTPREVWYGDAIWGHSEASALYVVLTPVENQDGVSRAISQQVNEHYRVVVSLIVVVAVVSALNKNCTHLTCPSIRAVINPLIAQTDV